MKHLFVPYGIAKQLMEKGFDENCLALIDSDNELHFLNASDADELEFDQKIGKYNGKQCLPCPTHQQVVDWLREKHDIDIWVQPFTMEDPNGKLNKADNSYSYFILKDGKFKKDECDFNSYYEALNKAIEHALTLI